MYFCTYLIEYRGFVVCKGNLSVAKGTRSTIPLQQYHRCIRGNVPIVLAIDLGRGDFPQALSFLMEYYCEPKLIEMNKVKYLIQLVLDRHSLEIHKACLN